MITEIYIKKLNINWNKIHEDATVLSNMISNISKNWKGILSVTRGGLFPALITAQNLNIHLIDTICIQSYIKETREEINIIKHNTIVENDGEDWIIIDDLVDTGNTMSAIKNLFPKAFFGTIYAKPMGKFAIDIFVHDIPQSTWIVFPWDLKPNVIN